MSRSRSGSFTPVEIAPRDELVAVKVDDAQNETTFAGGYRPAEAMTP